MATTTPTALRLFDWQRRVLACVVGPHAVAFVEAVLGPKQLTTGDDVFDVVTHDAADCQICGSCIGPLFIAGPLPPCTCEYEPSFTVNAFTFTTTAHCPHHGDATLDDACTCRDTPGWYPGRPAAQTCPLHGTHSHSKAAQ